MKTKKIISKIIESMQDMVAVLTCMADRLDKVEKALELDFICGRWVQPCDTLSLTIRKAPCGYRIVLLNRGKVIARYDAAVDADGNVMYGVPGGPVIGRVDYGHGDSFIILEHLGVFYLHHADSDTATIC